ncbi:MAG: thioredoxin domain-containing protein [Gemmatimonadota bacterium]|nr:thioredoxin domain-containing protein [Gemmatimonadota bacterium]
MAACKHLSGYQCALRTFSGVLLLCAATSCQAPEPSAEQIKAVLVRKPEILYAAIEAHPAEFMAVVDKAARATQSSRQAQATLNDSLRIEDELKHPKVGAIDHRAVLGNPTAPITIVEYTDLQCPYCRQEREVLVQLFKHYGDRVRLVVKQMPVTELHPHAMDGALMFEAVARQDPNKAYRLYDDVYEHQETFSKEGQAYLERAVARLGADLPRALRDQRSDAVRALVAADMAEGKRFGFTGTPGFLVNGVSLQGAYPLAAFEQLIDRQLAARPLAFAPR